MRALAVCAVGTMAIAFAGCPDPEGNPKTLWLAPQDSELDVQLVDTEPRPF